ncbi:3-hydroxybutyrate dehydrogenase [Plakobranchus ocellatus]|uniref:3-oxoacyl-[acyl-carrier-protein] reductase n=1 Tax=Plakobranchus ocellatus TaxID=259542 RepID=A0AAV4AWQ4_9GAST|nr:3-hydroxybutyrate dehydrogenase [Plakobranchus ocellatus]
MENQLSGKVALVTGSTSGIGKGIATLLASRGCSVVITGMVTQAEGEAQVQEFSQKYPGKFHFVGADFLKTEEVEKLGQDVLGLYPDGIHILVNCAAIPGRSPIESMTTEHWQQTLNVNLTAPFILIRTFLPAMTLRAIPGRSPIESMTTEHWQQTLSVNLTAPFILIRTFLPAMKLRGWGRIVNICSTLSLIGAINKAAYCASKAGLLGLTRTTALEGAAHGVACNAICPSYTDAPMSLSIIEKEAQKDGIPLEEEKVQFAKRNLPVGRLIRVEEIAELVQFAKRNLPVGRLIRVEEIAELVGFLCCCSTPCITGHPLFIDGGYLNKA